MHKIRQILFSEGTYQIEVIDSKGNKSCWPFLQLSDKGEVIDRFCTCKEAENGRMCAHQKRAQEAIFNAFDDPLHVRFRASLWYRLCFLAFERLGLRGAGQTAEGNLFAQSQTGDLLFTLNPLTEAGRRTIQEILFERVEETEETSIKFSKLPPEELQLFREGRPSEKLRFELSFWSDLAKWWMLLQESGAHYTIQFRANEGSLPHWIDLCFEDFECGFYIAKAHLEEVIPTLATVQSPLKVFDIPGKSIENIVYDREKRRFLLSHKEVVAKPSVPEPAQEIAVGAWLYIPDIGFYPSHYDPLFLEESIEERHIADVLNHQAPLVEKYLGNEKVHRGHYELQYHLELQVPSGLKITAYLFTPFDLSSPLAAHYDGWVYTPDRGFYQIQTPPLGGVERTIPLDRLSDFVAEHRVWLSHFQGFELHIAAVEAKLHYFLKEGGSLCLSAYYDLLEEEEAAVDVGEWIYIRGKGFYPKIARSLEALIHEGKEVPKERVSAFVQKHREELEHTSGFFAQECPVMRAGLIVELGEKGCVEITPRILYKADVAEQDVVFYGDLTYEKGKGFSFLDAEARLPESYTEKRILSKADSIRFVCTEMKMLAGSILKIDPRLHTPKELTLTLHEIKRDRSTKVPTWVVEMTYESALGSASVFEMYQAICERKSALFSNAGLILFPNMRFNWLKGLSKRKFLKKGSKIRLSTLEWIRLSMLEEIAGPFGDALKARRSRLLLKRLQTFAAEEEPNISGLLSKLRPYQESGLQWLWFLHQNGLSGLLCDDMGLGKTHQAMALLAAASNQQGERKGKYLVVCPTSVLYHWEDLLARFFPKLKITLFHGMLRKLPEEYDLILTSYGVVRTSTAILKEISFDVAIFDELQAAKNPKSKTHKVLKALKAHMRLGLTGTPIENRLLELKALYDIAVPGYLPQEAAFRQLFVHPIEKNQDKERLALFRRLIRPFMLRRKKQEVLLELPEKTEQIAYCPLSDEQRLLYEKVVLEHKEALLQELEKRGAPIPYLHIFSLLSTLKQICNHPALFLKTISQAPRHASGKWELFTELVQEALGSGQKVVVFSQYVGMLDIIEGYLKGEKIGYAGIRGATKDRKEQMDLFKNDPQCAVFVASLKAAGVGVDLVAASVVIHYDRWWNPAKENQATDRVHRIGQSRGVQVFKMVTKGTIEEHIHAMIERKLTLMHEAMSYDDQDALKTLNREELIALLRSLEIY